MLAVTHRPWRTCNLAGDPEVETDAHKRLLQSSLVDLGRIGDPLHRWDQVVAGAEGKVIVHIFVAVDVDLRSELPMARCRDEEVDVRRAIGSSLRRSTSTATNICTMTLPSA